MGTARSKSDSGRAAAGLWPSDGKVFDRTCTACPRLAEFLSDARDEFPEYYCGPVAPFGDTQARLVVIGLAPGMHGANATGRPFTGDHAGLLLYRTLHHFGFASRACCIAPCITSASPAVPNRSPVTMDWNSATVASPMR
jgi:uracil-DNA glycosylase